MLSNYSIRTKLTFFVVMLVAATGLLVAIYVAWQAYDGKRTEVKENGLAMSHLYQHVLVDPLRLGDDYLVYELISAPFKLKNGTNEEDATNQYLEAILLLDDRGIVQATSLPQHYPLASPFLRNEKNWPLAQMGLASIGETSPPQLIDGKNAHFFVVAPVGENGVKYGNLVLEYSLEELLNVLLFQFGRMASVIALICVLLILAAWQITRHFSRPLQTLTENMRMLAKRHGIELNVADRKRRDEVMQLHDVFHGLDKEVSGLLDTVAQRDEEQRAYLETLELLQDAVIEFTPQGELIRATEAWGRLTGRDRVSGYDITSSVHSEDQDELMEQISGLVHEQKQKISIRFRIRRQHDISGHYWVEGRFAPVTVGGKVVSIRGVVRDITNTYNQERQINHMALHDALTDLPNRVLLEDRMEMALTRASRNGTRVALGFFDLDHFKQVNDTFGHKVGDKLLKEVARRLGAVVRGTDTLSRWGGDEFVVLCPDLELLDSVNEIAQKIYSLSHDIIKIDGMEFPFTFSAGFAVYPDDASDSITLLAQADRAMFYAKAQGRNNIQFFNAIASKEIGRQSFYIQSRLAGAIRDGDIQAWLQPLICARTKQVLGAEVLARWHEEEEGWVPPSVFVPMAESMGLIDRLGQSVWQKALHVLPLLPEDHKLSVNLSKRQLFSSTIVEQFCADVEQAGIDPSRITLEITESIALSDVEYAKERISDLDRYGFYISVDDFGVGYSSLSQLHEIPADEIKLDISFVRRIHEKTGQSMVSAIISIAKSLEMKCVAEGVEDERTADLLISLGVDVLQGYYFAKPMPPEAYLSWLEAHNEAAVAANAGIRTGAE